MQNLSLKSAVTIFGYGAFYLSQRSGPESPYGIAHGQVSKERNVLTEQMRQQVQHRIELSNAIEKSKQGIVAANLP